MNTMQTLKRKTRQAAPSLCFIFAPLTIPSFQAADAPPKKAPAPSPAPAVKPEKAPPKAIPVSVPLPKKPMEVQYGFSKGGIKNQGKLKGLIGGRVMASSLENARLIYKLSGSKLDIHLMNSSSEEEFSSHLTLGDNGSVIEETQRSGREVEITRATVENVPFLGKNKAVRWFDGEVREVDDADRESLIDPNEIITTLFQIPVWTSTLRGDHRKKGLPFRLCLRGDPIQMRLTEGPAENKGELVYACEKLTGMPGAQTASALFTLTYDRAEMKASFVMPTKIKIHLSGLEMSLEREKQD